MPEKKAVNRQIVDNIENAQMSIEVVCTWKRYFEAECNYSEAYKKVLKKGVKILQVTELPRDKLDLTRAIEIERMFKDYPSNQVRYFPGRITTVFALIDNKTIFMALLPTDKLDDCPGLLSNDPCLINMSQKYFNIMWNEALEKPEP